MKKRISLFTLLFFAYFCNAQEKRALIVAIDQYEPPANAVIGGTARSLFKNLDGCVNDGRSMQSIIVSKFQFNPAKVDTLFNEAANRSAILKNMEELLTKSKKGDYAFIFYAGHGSQVPNSLSKETDKKDESIVPSDTWKNGVEDIRDKELAKIYNQFLDKGINLTVIMDCCHSGSLSRGPNLPGKFRFIEDANYDAKDASQPIPPESRKDGSFLIMASAQDNELAQEQKDENNIPHGAFTIALQQALEQQSVNASASNLFSSIRAILKSNGKKQEPVLGGQPERQQQTLFGFSKGSLPDKSLIAVSGFENNKVFLQGGFALGLQKENELVKFNGKDTLVKLEIDSIYSVNRSRAKIIKGEKKDIKPGELLEVTNWVSSSAPLLKVFIPTSILSFAEVEKLASVSKSVRDSKKVQWVTDLEKTDPYTSVYYDGQSFRINTNGKEIPAPAAITAAALLQACKKDSSLYFELPVVNELSTAFTERLKLSGNKSIVVVNDMSEAHYIVYGTINEDGILSYGLRRTQTAARDSLESMPVQTKCFSLNDNTTASLDEVTSELYDYAMRLSKIRGWIQLTGPKDGESNFPFHLELINKETGEKITDNAYKVGQSIEYHLVADNKFTGANKVKRFVYVFVIDKSGNMGLAYPDADAGNVANQFPKFEDFVLVKDVVLFSGTVAEPVGTDNYFVLASDEPITNYAMVFNQEGVRGADTNQKSPLGNLLNLGNEGGTRGFTKSVSNWNLIKLAVKSSY